MKQGGICLSHNGTVDILLSNNDRMNIFLSHNQTGGISLAMKQHMTCAFCQYSQTKS